MVDILSSALPLDFYKQEAWRDNLVNFYGREQKMLPADCLRSPMQTLTKAMYDVTYIYGNFPDIVHAALGQCIDPTFEPEEYYNKIYKFLKNAGERDKLTYIIEYADGLLALRLLFTRDKKFLKENFSSEIAITPGEGENSKYEKFASTIQKITKTHVKQIRDMIEERG